MIPWLLLLGAGLRAPEAAVQSDPGDFLGIFVLAGSGGLSGPYGLIFGPDGHLYVSSAFSDAVLRYDGVTGAFIDAFVAAGSGGLDAPRGLVFSSAGDLFVSSFLTDEVLRYHGTTGAFVDVFVPEGSGWLDGPSGLVFGPAGDLFVSSSASDEVLRYVRPVTTRYVSPGGTDAGNDCTNAANPCATIAHAVGQADGDDVLHLASGVYLEPGLLVDKALIVVGQGVVVR